MNHYIQFLPRTIDHGDALSVSYDYALVIVSCLLAALASFSGLQLSERISSAQTGRAKGAWLVGGSMAMGIGIWSMHFTGMLAVSLPIPVSYDPVMTAASAIPAILASALAIYIMSRRGHRHRRNLIGGALVGAGIGTMHFMGMAAMRMNAMHYYEPGLFTLAILVVVVLGIASLYIHDLSHELGYLRGGKLQVFVAAGLMGLAISGMHYTAMTAWYVLPTPGAGTQTGTAGQTTEAFWLSVGVTLAAIALALLAIVAAIVDRQFQLVENYLHGDRRRMIEAIEGVSDGFVLFDEKEKLVICNHAYGEIDPALKARVKLGASYRDVITIWASLCGKLPGDVSVQDYIAASLDRLNEGRAAGEPEEIQLRNGHWIYNRQISLKSGGLVAISTDITEIKNLQAVFEKQATVDALTGLSSRRLFDDRLEHAIARTRRSGSTLPLLFIDLDKFKPINDTMGHDAGDAVLKEVARRIKRAVRECDTVARLGGDEFAVLIEPDGDQAGAELVASRVIGAVRQPILLNDQRQASVDASIGIAVLPASTLSKEALLKAADQAMYRAKKAGGNRYHVHAHAPVSPVRSDTAGKRVRSAS